MAEIWSEVVPAGSMGLPPIGAPPSSQRAAQPAGSPSCRRRLPRRRGWCRWRSRPPAGGGRHAWVWVAAGGRRRRQRPVQRGAGSWGHARGPQLGEWRRVWAGGRLPAAKPVGQSPQCSAKPPAPHCVNMWGHSMPIAGDCAHLHPQGAASGPGGSHSAGGVDASGSKHPGGNEERLGDENRALGAGCQHLEPCCAAAK